MPGPPEPRLRRHAVAACVALAYLIVFPYFEKLNNPNENVRVWMTRAIVAHGTFAIDAVEREWGPVTDRATDGQRRFSGKAPGTSLLGVPVLFVQTQLWKVAGAGVPSKRATTWALRFFTVALPLAAFFCLFAGAVERETGSPAARDLLTVGLGLGTMMYPYGVAFIGHAQAAALLFAGHLAARASGAPPRRLALGGALVGLAVVFEYQALFAAVAVAGYLTLVHRRRVLAFFAGAAGPAGLLGAYHTALFGRPWETPLGHVEDPVFRLYHQQGFLGFVTPRLEVMERALFSVDYGLFLWSPFLLAGLAAAVGVARAKQREHRRELVTILAVTAVMMLFLAGMANWRGGWCAGGPRYIAAVVPFLAWALALSWRAFWQSRPLLVGILAGLVLASVAACALAGAHFPHYPLQFDNPLFDLTLPLLGDGYAAHSLGTLLGLRGLVSYLPLALVLLAALALTARSLWRPLRWRLAAAPILAAALFAVVGLANGRTTADERHATNVVRAAWEPAPP